ncbi:hypothetical protein LCGC14_2700530 [marine sediment metagenome]|uniref:Response regulatory domain-containing protein n=1 Tax=marine sediment metagenome TaxID=412755 RepID=A0A0F8ZFU0_9ZZZZ
MSEKPRAIYFCDADDDMQQECESIQRYLAKVVGLDIPVELWERPPWRERFDILFFDWGGMSIGNSLLESFCGQIIENAEDNPGRIYIMTSQFTSYAMKEAINELSNRPNNIYLSIEKAKLALECLKV